MAQKLSACSAAGKSELIFLAASYGLAFIGIRKMNQQIRALSPSQMNKSVFASGIYLVLGISCFCAPFLEAL